MFVKTDYNITLWPCSYIFKIFATKFATNLCSYVLLVWPCGHKTSRLTYFPHLFYFIHKISNISVQDRELRLLLIWRHS